MEAKSSHAKGYRRRRTQPPPEGQLAFDLESGEPPPSLPHALLPNNYGGKTAGAVIETDLRGSRDQLIVTGFTSLEKIVTYLASYYGTENTNLIDGAPPGQRAVLIDEAIDLLHERIALIHAKDRRADGQVVAAGQGVVDFVRFLTRVRRSGFDGAIVTHGLASHEAAGVALFLQGAVTAAERGT